MAKTYLDQIVEYPAKVMFRLAEDKYCTGLLTNKAFNEVGEDDVDTAADEFIKDYQYVDDTVQQVAAYIWVEMEVNRVDNKTMKGIRLYVSVACHKNYMTLNRQMFKGIRGNRRDNLVRFVDKVLNNSEFLGLGALKLHSVRTVTPINSFTIREITYEIPDFNIVEIKE